jgi:crotonobetainyl-CoA:carnitine CoA-transferase CaiB-like acyl-CoA transferase
MVSADTVRPEDPVRVKALAAAASSRPDSPLADVLVIETGEGVAVAFCGKLLADFGATVVKVEHPGGGDVVRKMEPLFHASEGDGPSALHFFLNANKLGITLDHTTTRGKEILRKLARSADIVTTFAPSDGLDTRTTRLETSGTDQPGPVEVTLSWLGQSGPWRSFACNDFLAQHVSGMAFATAVRVADPSRQPPLATAGHLAEMVGGLAAATAGVIGLFEREFQGESDRIDVAIAEAVTSFMRQEVVTYTYGAGLMSRSKLARSPIAAPVFQQPTADGYVDMLILQEAPWRALLDILGNPAWSENELFATHPSRAQYWDALEPLLQEELRRVTTEQVYSEGQRRGIAISPINSVADAAAASQFAERGFFGVAEHPIFGSIRLPGPPFRLADNSVPHASAPDLGQHNSDVFIGWLGYSPEELSGLAHAGVV